MLHEFQHAFPTGCAKRSLVISVSVRGALVGTRCEHFHGVHGGERRNSAPGAYRAAQIRVARICAYPMLIAYYAYTNAEEEDAGCELAYRRQALRFSYTITPGSRHLIRMRGECACFTVLQSAESRRLFCPDESDQEER